MSTTGQNWERDALLPQLREGEVHLWRVGVNDHVDRLSRFVATLTEEERVRAKRFRFDRDRNMYVLSRGVLRRLLSAYTGRHMRDLVICYGAQGKPELDGESDVEFNLSHSGRLCVLAFSRQRVGVDIEEKAREVSFLDLADRFFSSVERNAIAEMSEREIRDAFYAVWTRKEAYIKALGEGVTHGLDNFAVTVQPDERNPRITSSRDPDAGSRWHLVSFEPESGYAGALAVEGAPRRIITRDYTGFW